MEMEKFCTVHQEFLQDLFSTHNIEEEERSIDMMMMMKMMIRLLLLLLLLWENMGK